MKSIRKKGLLIIVGVLLLFLLSACSQKTFTEKQEEDFMNDYLDKAMEPVEPYELIKLLDKNIDKLSLDGATDAVDGLLYNMYQKMTVLNSNVQGFQPSFAHYEDEGIDFNNPNDLSKIEDNVFKTLLEEVQNNNLRIKKEGEMYSVQPNMDLIIEKYEEYIRDDLKAMVYFSKDEYDNGFYDPVNEKFNLDLVAERILTLEENLSEFEGSYYIDGMKDAKVYYYQIYFGIKHDDFKNEDGTLSNDVLEHYQKVAEEYKDTKFGKDVQGVLEQLKETNNIITDNLYVYLLDLTEYETLDYSSDEGLLDGDGEISDEEVLDAINKTLEQNSEQKETSNEEEK